MKHSSTAATLPMIKLWIGLENIDSEDENDDMFNDPKWCCPDGWGQRGDNQIQNKTGAISWLKDWTN